MNRIYSFPAIFMLLVLQLFMFSFSTLAQPKNLNTDLYSEFLQADQYLREHSFVMEQITDMVDVYTVDSTYKRKAERHQMFGAALFRLVGFRWKTVKYTREKLVGVVTSHSKSGEERYTEYDVNYNILPHIDTYLELSYEAYQDQISMHKSKKKKKKGQPPFIHPSEAEDLSSYKIHCECTPHDDFRDVLNSTFYPTKYPMNLGNHPNFMQENPVMGVYGPLVLDCNHKCHPEIHPYDWIWWMDVSSEETKNAQTTTWHVGFLGDASNRFKHWTTSPRTGAISIPFVFPFSSENWSVQINHELFNGFDGEAFMQLSVPEEALDFFNTENIIQVLVDAGADVIDKRNIQILSNIPIYSNGIKYWIEKVGQTDQLWIGKLHIAASILDIYTAKIQFKQDDRK